MKQPCRKPPQKICIERDYQRVGRLVCKKQKGWARTMISMTMIKVQEQGAVNAGKSSDDGMRNKNSTKACRDKGMGIQQS